LSFLLLPCLFVFFSVFSSSLSFLLLCLFFFFPVSSSSFVLSLFLLCLFFLFLVSTSFFRRVGSTLLAIKTTQDWTVAQNFKLPITYLTR
jgi:hypothetical protein